MIRLLVGTGRQDNGIEIIHGFVLVASGMRGSKFHVAGTEWIWGDDLLIDVQIPDPVYREGGCSRPSVPYRGNEKNNRIGVLSSEGGAEIPNPEGVSDMR